MHIPVLLLSARAGEEATIEGLQSGADDYLVKPFSAKELLSRIDSNIKIARSRSFAFRQLHNLFMQAPVPIAILRGKEQRYEMANEQYLEVAGRSGVVGKTLREVFPELEDDTVHVLLDQVFETGIPVFGNEFEVKITRHGKFETVYFNFVYSPFRDMDGRIIGVMVVAIDISEMVRAKKVLEENEARLERDVEIRTEELSRANEALRHSNKELEQFAFVTSHDLQEPLRKIQTYALLLQDKNQGKFDERSGEYFSKLLNSSNRMKTLINDLLNFSRLISSGDFLKVDLNDIERNVESDFELVIAEKGATIKSDELPAIETIPLQMNQLFTNLIGNALKFSSVDRKPVITITSKILSARETERFPVLDKNVRHVQITFADNGIGFDNTYTERIFEMFQRLNERSLYEGTGIGLALCSRIVANHHGTIYADGQEGEGAAFHVILPVSQTGSRRVMA
jgi:PAS domain S-box-containing protein